MIEVKKKAEEEAKNNEALEEYKKKVARETEAYMAQLEDARNAGDRLEKSRRKLQEEVDDANMELEKQRSGVVAFEKRQRKFDQLLAEEKTVSERWVGHSMPWCLFICHMKAAFISISNYLFLKLHNHTV